MTQILERGNKTDTPADQLPAELAWIGLLPDGLTLPPGYIEAELARAAIAERHNEVGALIAERDAVLRELVAGGCSPLDYADRPELAELVGLRAYAEQLPPIPRPTADADVIAEVLGQHVPTISAGPPPLWAAECVHHIEAHSQDRTLPPAPHGRDLDVLAAYEQLAAAAPVQWQTAQVLRAPLNGSSLAGRVEAWHAWTHGALADWLRVAELVGQHVAAADAARLASRHAHRCRFWSGAPCANLDPPPGNVAWTLELAAAGRVPHRPVSARSGPAVIP